MKISTAMTKYGLWLVLLAGLLAVMPVSAQEAEHLDHIAWNQTGTLLAINHVFTLDIADETRQTLMSVEDMWLSSLAWSPADPARLAASDRFGGIVHIFNFSGEELEEEHQILTGMGLVLKIAWSADGVYLAVIGQNEAVADVSFARVWNTTTGEISAEYKIENQSLGDIDWRPGHPSELLITRSADTGVVFLLWDTADNAIRWQTLETFGNMPEAAWSPDGETFASLLFWDAVLHLHDGSSGEILHEIPDHTGYATGILWSPFTNLMIYGSGLEVIDVVKLETVTQMEFDVTEALAVSPAGEVAYGETLEQLTIILNVGLEPVMAQLCEGCQQSP
jgi:WD40 repeat protein